MGVAARGTAPFPMRLAGAFSGGTHKAREKSPPAPVPRDHRFHASMNSSPFLTGWRSGAFPRPVVTPITLPPLGPNGVSGEARLSGLEFSSQGGRTGLLRTFAGDIDEATGRGIIAQSQERVPLQGSLPMRASRTRQSRGTRIEQTIGQQQQPYYMPQNSIQPQYPEEEQPLDLAAFLPNAYTGEGTLQSRTRTRGPYEPESMQELNDLLTNGDNVVIYFYMPKCPHCEHFDPVYDALAKAIHGTNRESLASKLVGFPPVPIVMARVDGATNRDAINELLPGFYGGPNGNTYPTILFKRGDGEMTVWDPNRPRDPDAIAEFMGDFFGDPSLEPVDPKRLYQFMNSPDPKFVYVGSDNVSVIPRFAHPLDPSYTSRDDALATLDLLFESDPELASQGAFYAANRTGRQDLSIPSIIEIDPNAPSRGRTFANRDAVAWAAHMLSDQLGVSIPEGTRAPTSISNYDDAYAQDGQYGFAM